MEHTNPYASPQSDIDRVDGAKYADVKVFSFSGRIGRMRYLAYSMGLMLIVAFGGSFMAAMMAPALSSQGDEVAGGIAGLVMVVVYAFMLVASFTFAVRRLNDLDTSGWMSLLLFVPIVNVIFGIALWLIPGTKGSNRFGPQPPPNGGGVTFLALLMPVVMVIGVLAAVAIPAYQQYVERAAEVRSQ
jgi:uncharacterized membrane protein YhaH (DUF805 family)